jgi:hypothetical protein
MNSTKVEEGRERAKPSAERRSNSQRIGQQLKPNLQAYKTRQNVHAALNVPCRSHLEEEGTSVLKSIRPNMQPTVK